MRLGDIVDSEPNQYNVHLNVHLKEQVLRRSSNPCLMIRGSIKMLDKGPINRNHSLGNLQCCRHASLVFYVIFFYELSILKKKVKFSCKEIMKVLRDRLVNYIVSF